MIKNPILCLSWHILEKLHNFNLNYLYVDTLAKEHVLQQKIEPNSYYTVSPNYSTWYLPYPYTVEDLKNVESNPLFCSCNSYAICNDNLCEITGINYYNFVKQYQNHIKIIDLDDFYKK